MRYFSYNDFYDCTENGEIDIVKENILKYEVKSEVKNKEKVQNAKDKILKILKNKSNFKKFLEEFFDFYEVNNIESIQYVNNDRLNSDKEKNNNLIFKIKEKEIFILLKVIKDIDNNISYKMLENSINIIKRWNEEENMKNIRYPIVIPIVIYIGKKQWKNCYRKCNKINYMTCEHNRINFSYNMIDINNFEIQQLTNMKSKIAKEFIDIKNKYLQIN